MPGTIAPREYNKDNWQLPHWEDGMVQAIGRAKNFRWFDSGDVYDVKLARKIKNVMTRTPKNSALVTDSHV